MTTMTLKDNIQGLGHDLIEIERIQQVLDRHKERFIERILTPNEQAEYRKRAHPVTYLAGRFAAKEAVAKALGCGIGKQLSWQEIEILSDHLGKPCVFLSTKKSRLLISISHTRGYASAVAIATNN